MRKFLAFLCLTSSLLAADYRFSGTADERHDEMVEHYEKMKTQPGIWERKYMTGDWEEDGQS
ncbi:MAG: hypothetical protein H7A42_02005 [Chlamydiales bacterium]|nr:hypothetical protein [Chlamydiales bacterium]